jgi:hypothetical protein
MKRFENKVVLVTGGTVGIGLGAAEAFAREGARVVVSARREGEGLAAAKKIRDAGGKASFFRADVSSEADVRASARFTMRGVMKIRSSLRGRLETDGARWKSTPRIGMSPSSGRRSDGGLDVAAGVARVDPADDRGAEEPSAEERDLMSRSVSASRLRIVGSPRAEVLVEVGLVAVDAHVHRDAAVGVTCGRTRSWSLASWKAVCTPCALTCEYGISVPCAMRASRLSSVRMRGELEMMRSTAGLGGGEAHVEVDVVARRSRA